MWGRMMSGEGGGEDKLARLFEALDGAPQPEDRRQALSALGEMASEQAVRVRGAEWVGVLLRVLAGAEDVETRREVVDVLDDLLDPNVPSSDLAAAAAKSAHNMDALLEEPGAVHAILGCLEQDDQRTRYGTIQLMLRVLGAERGRVQGCVLANPMGAAAATELLSDRREVVRNDGLLLLAELAAGSAEICRLVAFQGAFDRLLEIVQAEAEEGGSVILDDALGLARTLLLANPPCQRLFVESGGVEQLLPLLCAEPADPLTAQFAPKQLTASQVRICDVLSALVDEPAHAAGWTARCADEGSARDSRGRLGSAGALAALLQLAASAATATEPALRAAAMRALAGALRSHEPNRRLLLGLSVPLPPSRVEPAPLRLLSLGLRGATRGAAEPPLRVLRALIDGSAHVQLHLAASLAPVPTGLRAAPAGGEGERGRAQCLEPTFCGSLAHLLLGGGAPSPAQAQLAASVVTCLLRGNADVQELLLRTPAEASLDDPAEAPRGAGADDAVDAAVPPAAGAGFLGRLCARLLSVARPAPEAVDDAELDMARASHCLGLLRCGCAFAGGCDAAVRLLLAWPQLLPTLAELAAGGAAPEAEGAGSLRRARPPPIAADPAAAEQISGCAAWLLARCLLRAHGAAHGGLGAQEPLRQLRAAPGLPALLGALRALRASAPVAAAARAAAGEGALAPPAPPAAGGKGAPADPCVLPCVGPLPLYSAEEAADICAACEQLSAAISELSGAEGAPQAPTGPSEPSVAGAQPAAGEDAPAHAVQPNGGHAADHGAPAAADGGAAAREAEAAVAQAAAREGDARAAAAAAAAARDEACAQADAARSEADAASARADAASARADAASAARDEAAASAALHRADAGAALARAGALAGALGDADAELREVASAAAAAATAHAAALESAREAASAAAAAALGPAPTAPAAELASAGAQASVACVCAGAQASVDVSDASSVTDASSHAALPAEDRSPFSGAMAQQAQPHGRADGARPGGAADAQAAEQVAVAEAIAASALARADQLEAALRDAQELAARHERAAAAAGSELAAARAEAERGDAAAGASAAQEAAAARTAAEAASARADAEQARLQVLVAQLRAEAQGGAQRGAEAEARGAELAARAEAARADALGQAQAELEAARAELGSTAAEAQAARAHADSLAAQIDESAAAGRAVREEAASARAEAAALGAQLAEARAAQLASEQALRAKAELLEELESEHEECLCCLAEQDLQCTALQEQLARHGLPLPFPPTPVLTPTLGSAVR